MTETPRALVYSDDPKTRAAVLTAVGRRPAPELGPVEWLECATGEELLANVDGGGIWLAVLDGEARPAGGLGLAKQLKDELVDCPPTLVLIARKHDAWLGKWSMADAVETLPVDPPALTAAVAGLLRQYAAAVPVRRTHAL
ncbi:MAG: Two-component system response regulator [Frankiales bacterium]|nr:Two-component system response regulator [Frankiales bacterium]